MGEGKFLQIAQSVKVSTHKNVVDRLVIEVGRVRGAELELLK
jgi:hypothetical protein